MKYSRKMLLRIVPIIPGEFDLSGRPMDDEIEPEGPSTWKIECVISPSGFSEDFYISRVTREQLHALLPKVVATFMNTYERDHDDEGRRKDSGPPVPEPPPKLWSV